MHDAGVGIYEVHLHEVFDAFYTTKAPGLGCRSIIESHGGKLWVERTHDRGVTFIFALASWARSCQASDETESQWKT